MTTCPAITIPPTRLRVSQRLLQAWPFIGTSLLVVFAWHQTLIDMAERWMPLIHNANAPLFERLTGGDGYTHHGPAVLLISIILAFITYRRNNTPSNRTKNSRKLGWALAYSSIAIHLLALRVGINFISGYALIALIAGLLLIAGGQPLWRSYARPVLLLIFMVPLPIYVITYLTFPLKLFTGEWGVALANIFGAQAEVAGNNVNLPSHLDATQQLHIDDTCSGLRSLLTLAWLAGFYAAAAGYNTKRIVWTIALALPLALGCNLLRVTILILIGKYWGVDVVAPHTAIHQWVGLFAFAIAICTLLVIDRLTLHGSVSTRCQSVDQTQATLPRLPRTAWVMLAVTVSLTVYSATPNQPPSNNAGIQAKELPSAITIAGQKYLGVDMTVSERLRKHLGGAAVIHRRYIHPATRRTVDLVVVSHPSEPDAIHPPDLCLQSLGQRIIQEQNTQLIALDGSIIPARRLTTKTQASQHEHLYSFHTTSGWTNRYLIQRARASLLNILPSSGNHQTHGSVARLTIPHSTGNPQLDRTLNEQAAAQLLPAIEQALAD